MFPRSIGLYICACDIVIESLSETSVYTRYMRIVKQKRKAVCVYTLLHSKHTTNTQQHCASRQTQANAADTILFGHINQNTAMNTQAHSRLIIIDDMITDIRTCLACIVERISFPKSHSLASSSLRSYVPFHSKRFSTASP